MKVFFWVVDLITPVTMIIIGAIFIYMPPQKINSIYGYRTTRSMKTAATWAFAHYRCGQLWIRIGIILLTVVVLSKLFTPIEDECLSLIHMGIAVIALFLPIPIVEMELKRNFDEYGKPKD